MLSLLSSPTLTFVHDYWKNQSFDYMDTVTKGTYPDSSAQAPLWKILLCSDILLIHWGSYHWITMPFPDPSQILPSGIQKARLFFIGQDTLKIKIEYLRSDTRSKYTQDTISSEIQKAINPFPNHYCYWQEISIFPCNYLSDSPVSWSLF